MPDERTDYRLRVDADKLQCSGVYVGKPFELMTALVLEDTEANLRQDALVISAGLFPILLDSNSE